MLPQKFSAATTEIFPPDPDLTTTGPDVQPARHATSTMGHTAIHVLVTDLRVNEIDSQYKVGF
jgi:hypothetical protein